MNLHIQDYVSSLPLFPTKIFEQIDSMYYFTSWIPWDFVHRTSLLDFVAILEHTRHIQTACATSLARQGHVHSSLDPSWLHLYPLLNEYECLQSEERVYTK